MSDANSSLNSLQQSLTRLHDELSGAGKVDEPSRRLLQEVLGDIERVSLAGLPAARVRWTGAVGDTAAIGVMYCVLVGHSVVSLHTQDTGSTITAAMYSAISAIEHVRVR